jgi:transcriptional regulator with XRE-family HTH domain
MLTVVANRYRPIVPTLPTLSLVLSEEERKARLAYWIRDIRFRRGLKPPGLAERIGVSRSTVNKWESGEQVPSMIWLGPLATALSVDPRLFADLPEIPPSGAAEYLVEDAVAAGYLEGAARARRPRGGEAPSEPEQLPGQRPQSTGRE